MAMHHDGKSSEPEPNVDHAIQIGYLARLAPEKGLHVLVDAFLLLHEMLGESPPVRLQIAGWLGKQHEEYAAGQFAKLDAAGLGDRYEYLGSSRPCREATDAQPT